MKKVSALLSIVLMLAGCAANGTQSPVNNSVSQPASDSSVAAETAAKM